MTLCGKCMKPEPGCDCRPLAIPDSGNQRGGKTYGRSPIEAQWDKLTRMQALAELICKGSIVIR